jgi:hypothetical protein
MPSGPNEQRADLVDPGLQGYVGQRAVAVAEPVVLVHADRFEAVAQLLLPDRGEDVRRPRGGVVGAVLAVGGGRDDDAATGPSYRRHQAGGEVRLVVRVGPDAEQRADVRCGVHARHDPRRSFRGPALVRAAGKARGRSPSEGDGSTTRSPREST